MTSGVTGHLDSLWSEIWVRPETKVQFTRISLQALGSQLALLLLESSADNLSGRVRGQELLMVTSGGLVRPVEPKSTEHE